VKPRKFPTLRFKARLLADLRNADAETLCTKFSAVLERTVRELHGVSCLDLEEVVPDKQQIMCSRSFGERIYERTELGEAVASYVSRAAEILRGQEALAGALTSSSGRARSTPRNPSTRRR